MGKIPPAAEKDRSERWLLTYADLITLLLIFFIVLYVMSTRDVVKFQVMADSIVEAFTGTRNIVGEAPGPSFMHGIKGLNRTGQTKETKQRLKAEYIRQEMERVAESQNMGSAISVNMEDRGIVIRMEEKVLFGSGEADLGPEAREILQKVSQILKINKTQYMRIEGHTDNVPIASSRFPSNWELAAVRATSVVRLLVQNGIDPRMLSEAGYGEHRPIADNATPKGRAKNRRVEIVLLAEQLNKSEPPARRQEGL